jgi:phosphohistidine phosphatase SixA
VALEVLYLIRHSKAEESHPRGDRYRKLSTEGWARLDELAPEAERRGWRVDLVLSSTYVRALETRDRLFPRSLPIERGETSVYSPSGSPDDALDDLESREAEGHSRIAVVTHNPFVTLLAERLLIPGSLPEVEFAAPTILALGFDRGLKPREGRPLWMLSP